MNFEPESAPSWQFKRLFQHAVWAFARRPITEQAGGSATLLNYSRRLPNAQHRQKRHKSQHQKGLKWILLVHETMPLHNGRMKTFRTLGFVWLISSVGLCMDWPHSLFCRNCFSLRNAEFIGQLQIRKKKRPENGRSRKINGWVLNYAASISDSKLKRDRLWHKKWIHNYVDLLLMRRINLLLNKRKNVKLHSPLFAAFIGYAELSLHQGEKTPDRKSQQKRHVNAH